MDIETIRDFVSYSVKQTRKRFLGGVILDGEKQFLQGKITAYDEILEFMKEGK